MVQPYRVGWRHPERGRTARDEQERERAKLQNKCYKNKVHATNNVF